MKKKKTAQTERALNVGKQSTIATLASSQYRPAELRVGKLCPWLCFAINRHQHHAHLSLFFFFAVIIRNPSALPHTLLICNTLAHLPPSSGLSATLTYAYHSASVHQPDGSYPPPKTYKQLCMSVGPRTASSTRYY